MTQNKKQKRRQPHRLLIVDDNAEARAGLKALLETVSTPDSYLEVFEAVNGQEAIDLTESVQPDVILMDVQMPLLNGIEATRIIKRRWPAIKVVILTMNAQPQNEAVAAGADLFLLKGGAPDVLLTAVFQ